MAYPDFAALAEDLLSRALAREQERTEACRASDALTARVGQGVARWIGDDGWQALLARARVDGDDDLRVLLTIASILQRLIGANLVLRLLEQASEHPDEPPAGGPLG